MNTFSEHKAIAGCFYAICTLVAFWFPLAMAMLITLTRIIITGFWFSFKERNLSTLSWMLPAN